jgi:nitrogen regulatory protein PII
VESQALQLVVAYIQPFQLERVVDALRRLACTPGMSIVHIEGIGSTGAHPPRPGEHTEVSPFERHVRLESYCADEDVDAIVAAIQAAARTGHAGDGKIFVSPVVHAQRIRTGARGEAAVRP